MQPRLKVFGDCFDTNCYHWTLEECNVCIQPEQRLDFDACRGRPQPSSHRTKDLQLWKRERGWGRLELRKWRRNCFAILHVSKALHMTAERILYSSNTFWFADYPEHGTSEEAFISGLTTFQ